LKIEISRLSPEEAISLAHYLAGVVGRAHGRQMTSSQRRTWRSDLAKSHKLLKPHPGCGQASWN